jgi:hypothetical protein
MRLVIRPGSVRWPPPNRLALWGSIRKFYATRSAERSSALEIIEQIAGEAPCTVAADKAYDTQGFVAHLRQINAAPHVAQNTKRNGARRSTGAPPATSAMH